METITLPKKKDNFLPRISCSTSYRHIVEAKKKELGISYTNMIRLAFEDTWDIPRE